MKFKVGDRVKVVNPMDGYEANMGFIGTVKRIDLEGWPILAEKPPDGTTAFAPQELQLIKGEQTMGRRTFKLLKESPNVRKGAIYQEMCDDGTQDFQLLDPEEDMKFSWSGGDKVGGITPRDTILTQPKWFEEVFPLVPEYGTKAELQAFNKFRSKK